VSPIQSQPVNIYNNLVPRLDHHQNEDPDDQKNQVKGVGQLSKIYQDLYLMFSRKEFNLKPVIDGSH
jgi:hypothetical protein